MPVPTDIVKEILATNKDQGLPAFRTLVLYDVMNSIWDVAQEESIQETFRIKYHDSFDLIAKGIDVEVLYELLTTYNFLIEHTFEAPCTSSYHFANAEIDLTRLMFSQFEKDGCCFEPLRPTFWPSSLPDRRNPAPREQAQAILRYSSQYFTFWGDAFDSHIWNQHMDTSAKRKAHCDTCPFCEAHSQVEFLRTHSFRRADSPIADELPECPLLALYRMENGITTTD